MGVMRHILTGFMAGELDPHLDGRVETDQYRYGLATCENWIPINEGPLRKRQGFYRIAAAAETASWLSPFRRSIDQEYVVEWSELAARFFTLGGQLVLEGGDPYQITTPYLAAEAPALSMQQSFDRQYLNHEKYPPAALRRDDPTSFTYEVLGLENGPFLDANTDSGDTISANGTTGNVQLTSAAGHFDADHVGSTIKLEVQDFGNVVQWEPGMKDVVVNNICHNEGRVYVAETAGVTGQVEPTHSEGSFFDGQQKRDELNDKGPFGVKWRYLHDRIGVAEITAVPSANSATATVKRRLPDGVLSGTFKWAFSAFSEVEGWPSLVALFKARRIDTKGLDIFGSVAQDYGGGRVNYQAFDSSGIIADDLGFRRTIAAEDPPLWLSSERQLLMGTATREVAVGKASSSAPFSGVNIEADPQSFYGSERVFPVQIGTQTMFVERGGRRIRGADYDFGRDRYDAPDLTAAAREITRGGILQLAYQRIPYAFVHGVRGDGQIIVHPVSRGEIKGFARIKLGGDARALSAVSVVGADGKTDDLWLLIERPDKDGNPLREIWRQAPWRELGDPLAEAVFSDGAVRIEAVGGQTQLTGLTHLAGQSVVALLNGIVVKDLTVGDDGNLELPETAVPLDDYVAIVGLGYSALALTMRPHINSRSGGTSGLRQRVLKVVSRVLETIGLKVAAPGQEVPEETVLRNASDPMDQQIPLFSDDTDGLVEGEFDRSGRTFWLHDSPLPATISMAIFNIDVSERDE